MQLFLEAEFGKRLTQLTSKKNVSIFLTSLSLSLSLSEPIGTPSERIGAHSESVVKELQTNVN